MNQEADTAAAEILNRMQENTQRALLVQISVNRLLRKVLDFYANPENMREIQLTDQGKRARKALGRPQK